MHKNTKFLMGWADLMNKKHGPAPPEGCLPNGSDWCRVLAYYVGEAGNDYPSDRAISIAKSWLSFPPKQCLVCKQILLDDQLDVCVACSS